MRALLLAAIAVVLPSSLIRAQEQPPTAPPVHIVAEIKFCKVEYPTECRTVEIVPGDGREAVSLMECMRGVSMAAAEFEFEGERWHTHGGRCREEPNDYLAWKNKVAKDGRGH